MVESNGKLSLELSFYCDVMKIIIQFSESINYVKQLKHRIPGVPYAHQTIRFHFPQFRISFFCGMTHKCSHENALSVCLARIYFALSSPVSS